LPIRPGSDTVDFDPADGKSRIVAGIWYNTHCADLLPLQYGHGIKTLAAEHGPLRFYNTIMAKQRFAPAGRCRIRALALKQELKNHQKKALSVGMSTIASILLILILVFTSIGLVINDQTFTNNEFTKLGISDEMGISNADLVTAMQRLVDYMEGNADDINVDVTLNGETVNMFDYPQEAEHMADVRTIYMTIAAYRDGGVLVMLILFLFAAVVNFRMAPQRLAQGYLSGSFVMLLIFGFLGTWAALDFSNFWTFFHEALFLERLWLFDGTESRMINMLPEDLFCGYHRPRWNLCRLGYSGPDRFKHSCVGVLVRRV
jgi:integral membrane protein (TIGR01906 family)